MTHPNPHLAYRPDIDGLRAVAVLAVVVFHAFPAALPGGFVGVDIFFVISGYLISSIIFKALAGGEFSFVDFYARRIRRIFPPLLLVVFVSLVLGWVTLLPDEYAQLGKHAAAGLGFVANIVFWGEAGYFDEAAGLKPMLHLWSLGAEEQFYIVWPLVAVLSWRLGRRFWLVLAGLMAASFVTNIVLTWQAPAAAYFLLPSRAWEMFAGAALAWRMHRHGPLFFRNGTGKHWSAALGLALIAIAVVVIDPHRAFPGGWALLPTLGAVLVIAAGEDALPNRRFLATRFMVGMGLISFPLYLWHWPLLTFTRLVHGENAPAALLAAIVLVSVLLSWLSYRLLETPIRRRHGWIPITALATASVVLAGTSINILLRDGMAFRLKNAQAKQEAGALAWSNDLRGKVGCAALPAGMPGLCLVDAPQTRPNAILIGDSHANHYFWALSKALRPYGVNLVQVWEGGCGPLYGMTLIKHGKPSECRQLVDAAIDYAVKSPEIDTVFLGGRWVAYITGRELKDPPNYKSDERLTLPDEPGAEQFNRQEVFAHALDDSLRRLTAAGKRVIFLYSVPELPFNSRECITWNPNRFVNRTPRPDCQVSRAVNDARTAEYRPLLDSVLAKYPQVLTFDPMPLMCDDTACYGRQDGKLLYRDDDHLSFDGSSWLGEHMAPALPALLGRSPAKAQMAGGL